MESMFAIIAKELGVKPGQVESAVTLLDEGNTVPFIARYRKEVTGELQDEQLRTIEERIKYLRNLETRRQEIINAITEQEKMTDELMASLMKAVKLQELEDLYLPYRPKKRTRAMIARERGLEPLAEMIVNDTVTSGNPLDIAKEYISEEVPTPEDAIQGASDIVAEIVSDSADFRATLRVCGRKVLSKRNSWKIMNTRTNSFNIMSMLNQFGRCRPIVSWQLIEAKN